MLSQINTIIKMPVILNIETSGATCSAALSQNGELIEQRIESAPMKHAELLAPFIEDLLSVAARKEIKLDGVAVSNGPGSYTGLRIGLSIAKGLCYGLEDIPLILLSSLEILAVKTMFLNKPWEGTELFLPMIDARRMEVYAAVYDFRLNILQTPQPVIIGPDSFSEFSDRKLLLCGSGAEKTKPILTHENKVWVDSSEAIASDMIALSERAFRNRQFADLAYSVPEYIKSFRTSSPKNRIFS